MKKQGEREGWMEENRKKGKNGNELKKIKLYCARNFAKIG